MRKLLVLLIAVASLAAAGAAAQSGRTAAAASQTVTITHTGYKPASVSITAGEAVIFTNSDAATHLVDFKSTTGMSCATSIPFTLQPGQSVSCTFASVGKFNFTDPANKGKSFHGTVTVAKALLSSLAVTPKAVIYGRKTTLAGVLASQQAGQSVQVLGQACGATAATALATVTTTTGGAFSYQAQPSNQTAYTVKSKNLTSTAATVKVQPRLRLRKVARHRFSLRVFAAQSFAGKYATFQRYRPATKRWRGVKRVLLHANASGTAPTVITTAKFRSGIKARQRVRVVLGQKQVGACYLAGRSNTIRS
jgi:plastocyanin